jgi:aldose 1-epimerase
MTNRAAQPAPAGLGLHPFFPRHPETRIRFRSSATWLNDADQLPVERVAKDCAAGCAVAETECDNDFEGWDGIAEIVEPDGVTIRLEADAPFRWLRFYSRADRNALALEPVSHGANALNRPDPAALGVVALAPGGTLSGTIRLSVIA